MHTIYKFTLIALVVAICLGASIIIASPINVQDDTKRSETQFDTMTKDVLANENKNNNNEQLTKAQQPVPTKKIFSRNATNDVNISIVYPVFGIKAIDVDIERWSNEIYANSYSEVIKIFDAAPDDDMCERLKHDAGFEKCQVSGDFTFSYPSPNAISIVFSIHKYFGGAHGTIDYIGRTYDVSSGKKLDINDIFKYPDIALKLMSKWSLKILTERFSRESKNLGLIEGGTAPSMKNFSCMSLTPEGISITFEEYQVAPYSYGPQEVEIPLAVLSDAQPVMRLWGK
ncbi:MAG: DUF3298 and DUF4163 domain-containing protein [Desulfovibrio sp.]|jgi:hypothetical protein|nr:DUF3298 and DUF4163 domain-containing protein [Desulfovibrio sp.]